MSKVVLSKLDIAQLNQFENFFSFKLTWVLLQFLHCTCQIISFFTGNQFGKTGSVALGYVLRILGVHPVPKRNVMYFECEKRAKLEDFAYDKELYRREFDRYLKSHSARDSATWNVITRPKDNKCPECGSQIVIHKRKTRVFRFASEVLPTQTGTVGGDTEQSAETNNSQYPEFKKWLPPFLLKKDITSRNTVITLHDPWAGTDFDGLFYKGADILVEFVSYKQSVQSGAGKQRLSVWEDEEAPYDFHEEQTPRLLAEDGDIINTVTPANGISWTYDSIFEKAKVYYRTQTIVDYYKKNENKDVPRIEETDFEDDIAVFQAASDDNPTIAPDVIENMYSTMADPDGTVIPTRRYGIFKQATGRIFKDTSFKVHVIDPEKYDITRETLRDWTLARGIDFHEHNPWACVWMAISPWDECFVYHEWNPSPEKYVTVQICNEVAGMSGMEKYSLNLIDPNAAKKQTNTGKTTVEDINEIFWMLKKGKSIPTLTHQNSCMGGYWETWKTQGAVGRDEIKKRLANSLKVKEPFRNAIKEHGVTKHLPTLWVFKSCKETAKSLKHWRLESWKDNRQLAVKERKEKPADKWSHFCTAMEGIFKDKRFRAPRKRSPSHRKPIQYFQGAAA